MPPCSISRLTGIVRPRLQLHKVAVRWRVIQQAMREPFLLRQVLETSQRRDYKVAVVDLLRVCASVQESQIDLSRFEMCQVEQRDAGSRCGAGGKSHPPEAWFGTL